MYTTLFSVALFSSLAIRSVVADTIKVPNVELVQCKAAQLSWSGGNPPYDVVIVPPEHPCEDDKIISDLGGEHPVPNLEWNVAVKAGVEVVFSVVDRDGNEGWSGSMTVGASNDTSCLQALTVANSTSSATSSGVAPTTTLVVAPSTHSPVSTTSSSSGSDDGAATAVGAANAGVDPGIGNGALSTMRVNGPAMVLSSLAAIVLAVSL
ncbi:hypothetical protein C8Q75DRAFT_810718 [Abortiporus biennis]|nr:hypothetical protein C8Q75DRAFT_810718 [Abortiporus biennis]